MKINLLTIHYGKSYGAVMQTYATCKLLEQAGHEVTVINLVHPKSRCSIKTKRGIILLLKEFQFWTFKHRYFSKLSKKCYSIDARHMPNADIYVVGSDQVWNRDITGYWGLTFFLDFVDDTHKRIALSSSFGKHTWSENNEYTQDALSELNKFDRISVREESGLKILKDVFHIGGIRLLDPTIAYGNFEKLLLNKHESNYLYPFLFNNSQETQDIVAGIANMHSVRIFKNTRLIQCLFTGPRQWLTRIHNAKYVVTDSFHGLAFSIIFNKNFYVLCADKEKFTRIDSLLKLLGLSDRYIISSEDLKIRAADLKSDINYSVVNEIIEKERSRYVDFLESI